MYQKKVLNKLYSFKYLIINCFFKTKLGFLLYQKMKRLNLTVTKSNKKRELTKMNALSAGPGFDMRQLQTFDLVDNNTDEFIYQGDLGLFTVFKIKSHIDGQGMHIYSPPFFGLKLHRFKVLATDFRFGGQQYR